MKTRILSTFSWYDQFSSLNFDSRCLPSSVFRRFLGSLLETFGSLRSLWRDLDLFRWVFCVGGEYRWWLVRVCWNNWLATSWWPTWDTARMLGISLLKGIIVVRTLKRDVRIIRQISWLRTCSWSSCSFNTWHSCSWICQGNFKRHFRRRTFCSRSFFSLCAFAIARVRLAWLSAKNFSNLATRSFNCFCWPLLFLFYMGDIPWLWVPLADLWFPPCVSSHPLVSYPSRFAYSLALSSFEGVTYSEGSGAWKWHAFIFSLVDLWIVVITFWILHH